MSNCKRMTVRAIGVKMNDHSDFKVDTATNYSPQSNCTNIPGECGCVHAEQALLDKEQSFDLVYLTHSPCLECAKILHKQGVKLVIYKNQYRLIDGLVYLQEHNVKTLYLP